MCYGRFCPGFTALVLDSCVLFKCHCTQPLRAAIHHALILLSSLFYITQGKQRLGDGLNIMTNPLSTWHGNYRPITDPPGGFTVPSIAAVPASSSCNARSSFLSFCLQLVHPVVSQKGFLLWDPGSLCFHCGSLAPSRTQNVQTRVSDKALVPWRWQFLFCITLCEQ